MTNSGINSLLQWPKSPATEDIGGAPYGPGERQTRKHAEQIIAAL